MSATATTTLDWSQLHSLYQTVHDQHEHSCTVLARVQRDQRTNEPKWIVGLIAGGTDAEDKHYYSTEIEQEWLKKQVDLAEHKSGAADVLHTVRNCFESGKLAVMGLRESGEVEKGKKVQLKILVKADFNLSIPLERCEELPFNLETIVAELIATRNTYRSDAADFKRYEKEAHDMRDKVDKVEREKNKLSRELATAQENAGGSKSPTKRPIITGPRKMKKLAPVKIKEDFDSVSESD